MERWRGKEGSKNVRRETAAITDTGVVGESPYAPRSRNGATIFPRVLFFVNETDNPTIAPAARTVTVNPRRGVYDKAPWKNLDLAEISGQTIEDSHLFDVHLGETVAPYVTLEPLKALLPVRRDAASINVSADGTGGVNMGSLARRMRMRWRIVDGLWEANKAKANKLTLLGQLDYLHKLSAQLDWQNDSGDRPVRLAYTSSGQPTAAILRDDSALVENVLFWVACKDMEEANYLLAVINSDTLADAVNVYTVPNWSGRTRHLHKHLWKLPIPEYDAGVELHAEIAAAGKAAAAAARRRLAALREERGADVSVTIVRRELRKWLRASAEGRAVEAAVGGLLGGG